MGQSKTWSRHEPAIEDRGHPAWVLTVWFGESHSQLEKYVYLSELTDQGDRPYTIRWSRNSWIMPEELLKDVVAVMTTYLTAEIEDRYGLQLEFPQ